MEKAERRKKIISRGTDRMALITGRINTLDPDPISKCSSFTVARNDYDPPPQHVRSSSEPFAPNQPPVYRGDDASDALTKPDHIEELSEANDLRTKVSSHRKLEKKQTATLPPPDSSYSSENECSSFIGNYNNLTAKEINLGIVSTEDTRAICSIALGFLVVLSHLTLPRNVKPKSFIAYRPLYVILLTDVLVVASRLAPYTHMRREEKECKIEEDEFNFAGAIKYLELGVVLHQTICGFFVDCCFYLAVVVIGLSLM